MQKRLADFFKALVERKNIVRYCSVGVGVRWYALYCVRCAGEVSGWECGSEGCVYVLVYCACDRAGMV